MLWGKSAHAAAACYTSPMRRYLPLFILIFLVFLFLKDTLSFSFVSDDFTITTLENLGTAIGINPAYHHYTPVNEFIRFSLYKTFGFESYPFHVFALLIHLLNTVLVFFLARLLLKSDRKGLLASVLFALFFSHYEVIYWFGGTNSSMMTTFYILAILAFIRFVKRREVLWYMLFFLLFILALLTHEYAISLIFTSFFYFVLIVKKRNAKEIFAIFSLPMLAVLLTTSLKSKLIDVPLVVSIPTIPRFFASIVKSTLYLFIPNPNLIDGSPKALLVFAFFVLILFLLHKSLKEKNRAFFVLWLFSTMLMYASTSLPQARYFYVSSVPAVLFISSLSAIGTKSLRGLASAVFAIFIVGSGIFFLQEQKHYWRLSSAISDNTLKSIKRLYPNPKSSKELYLLNLPDSSNDSVWKAYVFRQGFDLALKQTYGFSPGKAHFRRTRSATNTTRDDPFIDPAELEFLKRRGHVIFAYDKLIGTVQLY